MADGTLLRGNALNLVAWLIDRPDFAVTYGGAAGDLGREFLAVVAQGRYSVVETPALLAWMKERRPEAITFATEILAQGDIFFSSSTLQYLADLIAPLRRGFASARQAVVLGRNCFSERECFTVQWSRLFDNGNGPIPAGWQDAEIIYPHPDLGRSKRYGGCPDVRIRASLALGVA